jgi:O-antigen ligase
MKTFLRIEQTLLLIVILTTFLYVSEIMDTFIIPKLFIIVAGAGILSALMFPHLLQFWKNGYRAPIILSTIFLFSLALASAFSKQSLIATLLGSYGRSNGFLLYGSLLLIFLGVVFVSNEKFYYNLLVSLSISGITLSIYGIFQVLGFDFIEWGMFKNEAILTFGNPNFSDVFLAFSLISTFYLFVSSTKNQKYFYLIALFPQMYLISISKVLQGKVITLACTTLLIGLILQNSSKKINRDLAKAWWTALVLGASAFLIGLLGFGPVAGLLQSNLSSFKDRTYHWLAAWEMFKSEPIFGIGIDAYRDNYRFFRSSEAIEFRGNVETWTSNAHNLFFQFAATGGLVLFLGYFSLLVFTVYRYFHTFRKLQNPKTRLLLNVYFALWFAYQLQSFISIDMPALALWGWIFSGGIIGISYLPDKEVVNPERQKGYAPVNKSGSTQQIDLKNVSGKWIYSLMILTLIPAYFVLSQIYFEYDYKQSRKALISATSVELIKANGAQLYEKSLHLKQPELRLDAIVKLLERDLGDQALSLAIKTTQDFPKSYGGWNAVASIYENSKDFEAAIFPRQMTIKLDPLNSNLVKLLSQSEDQISSTP